VPDLCQLLTSATPHEPREVVGTDEAKFGADQARPRSNCSTSLRRPQARAVHVHRLELDQEANRSRWSAGVP
jgi:hypothetical protein